MPGTNCAFCEIASGRSIAAIVFQDELSLAFLDSRPLFKGHVLLVPRQHCTTLGDLPDELIGPLFHRAKAVARAVESAIQAEGSFVAINNRVSQSVPHLHIHIVPRKRKDGLRGFFWPRTSYTTEAEMEEFRFKLREELTRIGAFV